MLYEVITVSPGPVTTFSTPAGSPASPKIEARVRFVRGVLLAGFSTRVFPEIRTGAIFQPMIRAGMFQGIMAAQTPRGFFTVKAYPFPGTGMKSPRRLPASPQ